ncbi:MAG: DinB family protein [Nocardioidaceae bacterium]
MVDAKQDLLDAMERGRKAVLWKIEGLSDQQVRQPGTATGTNLLGLVKHLSTVQLLYLGAVFGRPINDPPAWMTPDLERGSDLWVRPDESRDYIVATFHRASSHADTTIKQLDLTTTTDVPWVPYLGLQVSLHRVAVHTLGEVQRHAGHADLIRELIDGQSGKQPDERDLPNLNATQWQERRDLIEQVARTT